MGEEKALEKFSEKYGDITALRVFIQAIPYVGGSIDTLLSDSGQKIKWRRVEDFLQKINDRISNLEKAPEVSNLAEDENAYDLLSFGLEQAMKTRSEEKRSYFANIISNQISQPKDWDDAETALRLIADLSSIHVQILKLAVNAPESGEPFAKKKVFCVSSADAKQIETKGLPPIDISRELAGVAEGVLKFHCSELIARGLIKDEGIGRMGMGNMSHFIPTEMAFWLFSWISSS